MKKLLILGGTRYLGKAISSKLSTKEFEIATVSRSEKTLCEKHYVCDRKSISDLRKVVESFKPNVILDMVNFDSGDSDIVAELYAKGSLKELEHYLMVSTFFVYNHFDYKCYSEKPLHGDFDFELAPGYTKRKIQSELRIYVSKLMEITTVLRLPFVFSADDYSGRFQILCEIALSKIKHSNSSDLRYSLVRKNDAAEAVIRVIRSKILGFVDLCNTGSVSSNELVDTIWQVSSKFRLSPKYENIIFPYVVEKDICLDPQKIVIDVPILKAISIEATDYFNKKINFEKNPR